MTQSKPPIKIYKNPERDKPTTYKPYVPHYQLEGIEPTKYQGGTVPAHTLIVRPEPLPKENPRAPRPLVRQPYAEATPSPIGRGNGLPNVGNNIEQSWPSVDGHLVDDLSERGLDPNHPMIDNNEFMTDAALGGEFKSGVDAQVFPSPYQEVKIEAATIASTSSDNGELSSIVSHLEEDSFLLIANGTPLCSGPKEEIEEQCQLLVFGEHELCDGHAIPQEDLVVLKRVKVKVGLFLD